MSAAAAVLFATMPTLTGDQVLALLEQSAVDAVPANGCGLCAPGRDRFTGAGRLDQTGALDLLAAGAPPRDRYEPNDSGGTRAYPLYGARSDASTPRSTTGTTGTTSTASSSGPASVSRPRSSRAGEAQAGFSLWRPGTTAIGAGRGGDGPARGAPAGAAAALPGAGDRVVLVDLRMTRPGGGAYRLLVSKAR